MKFLKMKIKEIDLDIQLKVGSFFGEKCFMFIFYNKTHIQKLIQAEHKEKMSQVFVGSTSHELRTPLNCTMSILESAKLDKKFPKNLIEK